MSENSPMSSRGRLVIEKFNDMPQKENFTNESKYKKKKKLVTISGDSYKSGRWSHEEHQKFVEAIFIYGNDWKIVQKHICTRTSTQARSHAQKFLIRLKKKLQITSENDKITLNSLDKLSNDSVQSCIKEFITNSNGIQCIRNIDRDKLFKVILSFSSLLYFKSKKRSKKIARLPIDSDINQSKVEKSKIIDLLQNEVKSFPTYSNNIFRIEKIRKSLKFSNFQDEIKFLVEEKNILSTQKRSNKKWLSNSQKRRTYRKKLSLMDPYDSDTHLKISEKSKFEKNTKKQNEDISKKPNHITTLNKQLTNTSNSYINILNINLFSNNNANQINQNYKITENNKTNGNIYDDLVQYYGNNKKMTQFIQNHEENYHEYMNFSINQKTSTYSKSAKISNASTLTNESRANNEEWKRLNDNDEKIRIDELKTVLPFDNYYDDTNSLYLANNSFYNQNSNLNIKIDEDYLIDNFFDFK